MLKQVADLLVDPFATLRRFAGSSSGRTSAAEFRFGGGQFFANLGDCTQHGFGQFLDDMKLAKLMRHIAENFGNWLGIEVRTIGGDSLQAQSAFLQHRQKRAKETLHVGVRRVVSEYLVADASEGAVIDDR